MPNPRSCICCRVVMSTNPVPNSALMSAMVRSCSRVGQAVRHPHAHHEVARRLAAEEHAGPLQPLAVAFVDRLPSRLRDARHVVEDVEPVLLLLVALDLVERDDHVAVDRQRQRRRGGRRRLEQLRLGQRPGRRTRRSRCDFRPADAAAGAGARDVADRLQAARAAEHRLDDLAPCVTALQSQICAVSGMRSGAGGAGRARRSGRAARTAVATSGRDSRNAWISDGTTAPSPMHDGAGQPVVADDQLLVDAARRLRVADDLVVFFDRLLDRP